jgi:DNA-binding CsgD family transcriptional regulator
VSGMVGVVERAYHVDAAEGSWLESIRQAAESLFPYQVAAQAYTFTLSPTGDFQFGEVASDPELEVAMRRIHAAARPALLLNGYLRGPVTSPELVMGGNEDDPGIKLYSAMFEREGIQVTTGNGIDPSGNGCSLAIIRRNAPALTRQERHGLARIAAHLASAHRLRGTRGTGVGGQPRPSLSEGADAVLSADGSTLHAERDARDAETREALRNAARRIDRARMRASEGSPDDALALWRALVDGRWTLVEWFDTDGRRLFVARRNDPASQAHRALTELERKVVALLALGHSQKLCAYELGRSQSTVSAVARTALKKLGVRTRAELVELHGAIVSPVPA